MDDLGMQGGGLPPGAPPEASASGSAGSPGPGPTPSPHHDMLRSGMEQSFAQYQSVAKAHSLAQEIRSELDALVDKGEAITDDEVLDSMSRLVSKGADPKQLGGMIAGTEGTPPMPQGGPGLAAWIQQADQMLASKEQALEGPMASARLGAVNSALHVLVAHHVANKGGPSDAGANS